jgi:hypothetical protein
LSGLQQFEIQKFDVRIIVKAAVTFEIYFKELTIEGDHKTALTLNNLRLNGEGPVKITLKDVIVRGDFNLETISSGYLDLQEMSLSVNVGSAVAKVKGFGFVLDNSVSLLLSASLPKFINSGSDLINLRLNNELSLSANDFFNQFRLENILQGNFN